MYRPRIGIRIVEGLQILDQILSHQLHKISSVRPLEKRPLSPEQLQRAFSAQQWLQAYIQFGMRSGWQGIKCQWCHGAYENHFDKLGEPISREIGCLGWKPEGEE